MNKYPNLFINDFTLCDTLLSKSPPRSLIVSDEGIIHPFIFSFKFPILQLGIEVIDFEFSLLFPQCSYVGESFV